MVSCTRQPEVEPIGLNMRYAESAQPVLCPTVSNKRKPPEAEDTIVPAGSVPATLSGRGNDVLRLWNDEVVAWLVARKQALANSLDPFLMPRAFLWRERLEDHFVLGIAVHADPRAVDCRHNGGTSNRVQLRNQDSYGLERLFAEATLGGELMRSDHPLVDFIEQEFTQRLEVVEGLIDDR